MTDSEASLPFCIKSVAINMKKLSSESNIVEMDDSQKEETEVSEDVELLAFVEVYEELCKFIRMLGKIFEFVEKDVREKIDLLKELHSEDPVAYKSIVALVLTEKPIEKKGKESGAVAILHLNRALEFIVDFMHATAAATNDDSIPKICKECYDGTLAKHHPWIIRTAVKVAVYTLPSRAQMMECIKSSAAPDETTIRSHIEEVVSHGKVVHARINTIYTIHELHQIA